ncbi:MAG: hypothetical protein LYZ69_07335 [Nitrososphaerales archaeon]|nr:hypothetical protein [Nitrososphaerales archaeon]
MDDGRDVGAAPVVNTATLTEQEEQVDDILLQYGVTHLTHAVFPVKNRMYVVDFFLSGSRTILECWRSINRRGVALTWVEKNAAYVDLKFKRIKAAYPDIRSIALVEVAQAKVDLVREYVEPVMEHADTLCCSMDELAETIRRLCGVE